MGQYYLLIDPGVASGWAERLDQLARAAQTDRGARMPGQGKIAADPAKLDPAAWAQALDLAGRGA